MANWKKIFVITATLLLFVSCTCGVPLKVTSIQRSDKKLACKDIILEINESEHYREEAAKEQGIGAGEALMPICWISGYVDGNQAVKSANARINYLGHIYDLLDCGGIDNSKMRQPPPAAVAIPVAPAPPPRIISAKPLIKPDYSGKGSYKPMNDGGKIKLHQHKDAYKKIYVHSHPHTGPHRHLEDE